MALASAKALLDELMGRNRDLAPTEKKGSNWEDPEVCKHFLVKFCPNELFINTKADLGPCSKIHDENMKKEYEQSNHYMKSHYEDEFLRFCQGMLTDVEKRIRRAKQRLALGQKEGGMQSSAVAKDTEERSEQLTEKINDLLAQVEQLGCEGKVEEAQGIMKLCDQLKEEREALQKSSEPNHWLQNRVLMLKAKGIQQTAEIAVAQEKQMEVCEVCGAFLIVGDAQQRVDDHLMGKQHVGYARLKSAVEEIVHKREKNREEREKEREREREERRKQQQEEEKHRQNYHSRMDDQRKRDMRRSRRSRSRSRDRRRSRSRSRSRKHRSRSRDRSYYNRRGYYREREKMKDRYKYRSRSRSPDQRRRDNHTRSRDTKYRRQSRSRSPDISSDRRKGSSRDRDKRKHEGRGRDSPENGENSPELSDVDYKEKTGKGENYVNRTSKDGSEGESD